MTKKTKFLPLRPLLVHLEACEESLRWLARKKFRTFQEAVQACPKAGWLEWLVDMAHYEDPYAGLAAKEAQAYHAGIDAETAYWAELEKRSGSRVTDKNRREAHAVHRAAYVKELGDVWGEVEQRLIRIGLRDGVWK
jgi:hypothetical protein